MRNAEGASQGTALCAMSCRGVPQSTSTTPGRETAPPIVTRHVPGCAAVPRARKGSGPCRAIERDVGQCLSVVHECGKSADTQRRALVAPVQWEWFSPVDPLSQRRLLARDKPGGRPDEVLGHDRVPTFGALVDRTVHRVGDGIPPLGNAHEYLVRPARGRQQLGPVEDEVGGSCQQDLVLVAGRLALHAVDNEDPSPSIRIGHGELGPGREGSSATTRQSGRFEGRDECLLPGHMRESGRPQGAVGRQVAGEVDWVTEEMMPDGAGRFVRLARRFPLDIH